jgi:hypothetical protein
MNKYSSRAWSNTYHVISMTSLECNMIEAIKLWASFRGRQGNAISVMGAVLTSLNVDNDYSPEASNGKTQIVVYPVNHVGKAVA